MEMQVRMTGRRLRYLAAALAVTAATLGGCGPSAPRTVLIREGGQWVKVQAVEGTAQGELAIILLHMEDLEYGEVVDAAESFRKTYPVDYRREDVAMLAGHAEMHRGNYMKAHDWYTRQLDEFPAGELSEEALTREYRIADAFLRGRMQKVWYILRLPATEEAIDILTRIAERSPTSELAEDAMLRIADYYYHEMQFRQAAQAYDQYLTLFPKRRRSAFASLRAARATYATYRGAPYDSAPLIEANLRFRQYAATHPIEARAEDIDAILAEIADRRAEADFHVAQLYERLDRPKAAAFYYTQAAKRYGPNAWTARATEAAERLQDAIARAEGH